MATASTPESFRVTQLNGHSMEVRTRAEADFYTSQQGKYADENTFTAVSDLTDLDRLMMLELQMFRITILLGSGTDYDGRVLSQQTQIELRRQMKVVSDLISTVKGELGLSRNAREKAEHESVGAYIVNLRQRAVEQGVKREKELFTALTLMHELIGLIETYDRANETERIKLGFEGPQDLVEWIRVKLAPEFRAVDEHFRSHQQRYWVGSL